MPSVNPNEKIKGEGQNVQKKEPAKDGGANNEKNLPNGGEANG